MPEPAPIPHEMMPDHLPGMGIPLTMGEASSPGAEGLADYDSPWLIGSLTVALILTGYLLLSPTRCYHRYLRSLFKGVCRAAMDTVKSWQRPPLETELPRLTTEPRASWLFNNFLELLTRLVVNPLGWLSLILLIIAWLVAISVDRELPETMGYVLSTQERIYYEFPWILIQFAKEIIILAFLVGALINRPAFQLLARLRNRVPEMAPLLLWMMLITLLLGWFRSCLQPISFIRQ